MGQRVISNVCASLEILETLKVFLFLVKRCLGELNSVLVLLVLGNTLDRQNMLMACSRSPAKNLIGLANLSWESNLD